MRRPISRPRRLAPLDGGSSRRTTVMWLCPAGQSTYISLIRRRSRPIVSRAPAPSGIHLHKSAGRVPRRTRNRSEEHTSELQSLAYLVCRLLLEKKKKTKNDHTTR